MKPSCKAIILAVLSSIFIAFPAQAHHSFAATFTDEVITIEGYIERVRFSNPHVLVYLNVVEEDGTERSWHAEGGSPTSLRAQGWDRDTLSVGDYVRITGNSTRNGSPMISMNQEGAVQFVNPNNGRVTGSPGRENIVTNMVLDMPLQLPDGRPNVSSVWTGEATGRVGPPIQNIPPMAYNEAGAALQAVFDPVNDPQVWCEPPGLVRQAGFTPHPVRIQQYDDRVEISYEEYGGERTVYFDQRDMVGGEKTHLGQSWARYEDQKLVIESNNLLANLSTTAGNLVSDQTSTVETYYRQDTAEGRAVLMMDIVVTDPVYLLEPWTFTWGKYAEADPESYEFIEVDCTPPLEE